MKPADSNSFKATLAAVYGFYGRDLSDAALSIWWEAMRPFDFSAVRDAMNRHAVNPDNGQFLPKPADIVKLIGGGTQDAALQAWTKVMRAMREVGTYQTVCFDDALIHCVLEDMGGWVAIGDIVEDELPFKAKEFENRYRGCVTRGALSAYPSKLLGRTDQANLQRGFKQSPVVLVGDRRRAELVHAKGGERSSVIAGLLEAISE